MSPYQSDVIEKAIHSLMVLAVRTCDNLKLFFDTPCFIVGTIWMVNKSINREMREANFPYRLSLDLKLLEGFFQSVAEAVSGKEDFEE